MAKRFKKPSPLFYGDTIAVIAPAGQPDAEGIERSIQVLRRLGFAVVQYKEGHRDMAIPAFSASDEWRARELAWALSEPGIKAVFCSRAGYGSVRTIHRLCSNPALLRKIKASKPRGVFGYSDCTYLHQWIQNELGWISFHSPLVGFLESKHLRGFIESVVELPDHAEKLNLGKIEVLQKGSSGKARLLGGNLSLLQVNGRAALPREAMILCLEDIYEDHYRLDRMLWALIDAGYSKWVRGVVLGTFEKCGERDFKKFPWSTVVETLKKLCSGPIIRVSTFGHGLKEQRILPLGSWASVSSQGGLKILEPQIETRRT